ncbi:MAG: hypothetical protein PHU80_10750, partial [Kiritimatiellae bacterium]|nr:hypothetical protein [Kiritimatiellia bacterium]
VRDFMELYEGGRAPSIRLKTPEVRVDPAPVPVTRTVSESALPDRHAIKPQAAIKAVETDSALEVTDGEDDGVEKPKIRDVAMAVDDGIVRMAQQEEDMALVVSPEEEDADAVNEPDLFNLSSPPRHKPEVIKNAASGKAAEEKPHLTRRNQRLPVFKIGGQMGKDYMRDVGKEKAHARLEAIAKALAGAFGRLREAVVSVCPDNLPGMKVLAFGGAGLLAVLIMVSGLRAIFKMTGKNVAHAPAAVVERVAPPPELYVD